MTTTTQITTGDAPPAAHSFSQGLIKNGLLQVSGQGPVDPASGKYVHPGDVAAQTTRVLSNIEAILVAGGAAAADLLMLRVYLTNQEDFAAMNQAYGAFLTARITGGVLPCRTTVITGLPRTEMLVEIDALAVVDPS